MRYRYLTPSEIPVQTLSYEKIPDIYIKLKNLMNCVSDLLIWTPPGQGGPGSSVL